MSVTPSQFCDAGELPDRLAFVPPSRAELWIVLERYDRPQPTAELVDELGVSRATVHRMINDLEEADLVEQEIRADPGRRPVPAYSAVYPQPEEKGVDIPRIPVRADGGDRR